MITDPEDPSHFSDVLINPSELRGIENKAGSVKNPGLYLLNKVVELVFSKEELINSKSTYSLSSKKLEAIQGRERLKISFFLSCIQNICKVYTCGYISSFIMDLLVYPCNCMVRLVLLYYIVFPFFKTTSISWF